MEGQDGQKRQSVDIIADRVQFLGSRDSGGESGGARFSAQSDVPADTSDFSSEPVGASTGSADDDIPF